MKVVINVCYGGFSLSPQAVAAIAKRKGRPCYFFKSSLSGGDRFTRIEMPNDSDFMWSAFDIENPNEILDQSDFHTWTMEQRQASNALYNKHAHDMRPEDRSDTDLVAVVEELGEQSFGSCARLRVVEIPDGTEYEIEEYDGMEHVAEVHRTWA